MNVLNENLSVSMLKATAFLGDSEATEIEKVRESS